MFRKRNQKRSSIPKNFKPKQGSSLDKLNVKTEVDELEKPKKLDEFKLASESDIIEERIQTRSEPRSPNSGPGKRPSGSISRRPTSKNTTPTARPVPGSKLKTASTSSSARLKSSPMSRMGSGGSKSNTPSKSRGGVSPIKKTGTSGRIERTNSKLGSQDKVKKKKADEITLRSSTTVTVDAGELARASENGVTVEQVVVEEVKETESDFGEDVVEDKENVVSDDNSPAEKEESRETQEDEEVQKEEVVVDVKVEDEEDNEDKVDVKVEDEEDKEGKADVKVEDEEDKEGKADVKGEDKEDKEDKVDVKEEEDNIDKEEEEEMIENKEEEVKSDDEESDGKEEEQTEGGAAEEIEEPETEGVTEVGVDSEEMKRKADEVADLEMKLSENDPTHPPPRYIEGMHGDMPEATRRWAGTLAWRKENAIDGVLQEAVPQYPVIRKHYSHFFHGHGKSGSVALYLRPGMSDFAQLWKSPIANVNNPKSAAKERLVVPDDLVRHMVFMLESLFMHWGPTVKGINGERASSAEMQQLIAVFDLQGFSFRSLRSFFGVFKKVVKILEQHYVGRADRIMIINAPNFRNVAYLVFPLVPKEVKAKIEICGRKYQERLRDILVADEIPREYGGDSDVPVGEWVLEKHINYQYNHPQRKFPKHVPMTGEIIEDEEASEGGASEVEESDVKL